MKYALTFALILTTAASALAQQRHILYYKNGQKAVEGKWTYTNPLPAAFYELSRALYQNEQYGPRSVPDDLRYGLRQAGLGLAFDGQVQFWYADGKLWHKASYKQGALNGAYECYYPSGTLYCTGSFVNGMADGEWKYYYPNGKPSMENHYKAFTQEQLDALMKTAVETGNNSKNYARNIPADKRLSRIADAVDNRFASASGKLATGTRASGKQVSYTDDGKKQTELNYLDGIRHGSWIMYDKGEKLGEAVFQKDSLVALYNRSGENVLTVAGFSGAEDVNALYRTRRQQESIDLRKVAVGTYSGDPNGIDPGIDYGVPVPGPMIEEVMPPAIFKYVEEMPAFPGDVNAWLKKNMVYPEAEKKAGTEERIIVQFVVRKDGRAERGDILRGSNEAFKKEVLRLLNIMPKWKPGKNQGKAVDVYFTLPITFKLD